MHGPRRLIGQNKVRDGGADGELFGRGRQTEFLAVAGNHAIGRQRLRAQISQHGAAFRHFELELDPRTGRQTREFGRVLHAKRHRHRWHVAADLAMGNRDRLAVALHAQDQAFGRIAFGTAGHSQSTNERQNGAGKTACAAFSGSTAHRAARRDWGFRHMGRTRRCSRAKPSAPVP